jgi:YesN/AraC family two-component response regulator
MVLRGLKPIKASTFDIVITDIMMPKMTGIEMLEEIKKMNPAPRDDDHVRVHRK